MNDVEPADAGGVDVRPNAKAPRDARTVTTARRKPGPALRKAAWATEWRWVYSPNAVGVWRSYPGATVTPRVSTLGWQSPGRRVASRVVVRLMPMVRPDRLTRAFERGIVYACAEMCRVGTTSLAEEILRNAGITSMDALQATGADTFDQDAVARVVRDLAAGRITTDEHARRR